MNNIQHKKNIVLEKLSQIIKKETEIEFLIGILKLSSALLLAFGVLTFFESFNYFSPEVKFILFIVFLTFFILLLFLWVLKPLKNIFKKNTLAEYYHISKKIGFHFPEVKDNLLNSLQLLEDKHNTSLSLTNAAFESVYKKIHKLDLAKIIDYTSLKKIFNIFIALFSLSFFSILVFPQMRSASLRLIHFNTQYIKPSEFNLEVLKMNFKIKKNGTLTIKVKGIGKVPDNISIATKTKLETEFIEHIVPADSNNIFKLKLDGIKNSFSFFAHKDKVRTKEFFVEVLNPPIINSLRLKIIPPRYSHLPSFIQEDNGNVEVLPGTKINFNINSTKDLLYVNLIKNDSAKIPLTVQKNKAMGSINVYNNFNYQIRLVDTDSSKNNNPIKYEVKTLLDNFPFITIFAPKKNSFLPQNDLLAVNSLIKDDYGFSKLILHYRITESLFTKPDINFIDIKIPITKNELEQQVFYNWDLGNLQLKEKDVVTFYLEVFDNDNINGPKSTKSELFKIRVPSLNELFKQAEISQNNAVQDLTETLKESEKLKKELKEISDELKQNKKKIDWNEKEKIEKSVEKFKKLAKKIDDIQSNIDKMKKEMTQNNLLSEETMKKYNELQNLMNELNSDALQKALEKMQKALQQLNRDQVQNNMENFADSEEAFKQSIERTLNLLKRIQIEQKVDEVIKRTEKLTKDIQKLSEETNKKINEQSDLNKKSLTNKQIKIDDQLKDLKKELNKLNKKMQEVNDMPQKEMNNIKENFEKQKNSEISKNTMDELQKSDFQKAMENMQQLSKNMNSTMTQMQQIKKQMQMKNQQMVMQDMMKTINDIISASKEEEALQQKTEQNKFRPSQFPQMAKEQMELSQNLEGILKQMSKLSQKTFAITPEMGKSLGKARQSMKEAISGLQNRNGNQASSKQSDAMKSLNESAMLMQNSLQQMMQGGGQGSGMMSLMQQLQQLSKQQMGLNKLTQQLKKGQLTMQQQAAMQRLAQEQSRIQKSLDELNKEAKQSGKSKKIASNLDNVLKEMKEVISGFNTHKINDDLIKKQERILSKLLDAQRSINERDFEKKRESRIGSKFKNKSPSELNLQNQTIEDNLREELIKAVREGYSKDYQELIRKYFEELKKTNGNEIKN